MQACRVADVVAELDEAADEAPLTVKGSMGQQVISPFIAEARAQRSLLAQLLARLNFEGDRRLMPDAEDARRNRTAEGQRSRRSSCPSAQTN